MAIDSPPRPRASRGVRTPGLVTVLATVAVAAACLAAALLLPGKVAAAVVLGVVVVVVLYRPLVSWTGLLVTLALVVMLIPVRRYSLPVTLPFALEPYRALIVLLAVVLTVALLVDPRVRLRSLGFGGIIVVFIGSSIVSIAANAGPLSSAGLGGGALGGVLGDLLYVIVFIVVRTALTRRVQVTTLLMVLVGCGGFVGLSAIIERVTKFNLFFHLNTVLPLKLLSEGAPILRTGGARAFGSAGHPIALSMVLTMLIPFALYLVTYGPRPLTEGARRVVWGGCAVSMLAGSVVTVSRTGIVMLVVMGLVALVLRPRILPRVLALVLPAGFVLAAVAPSALRGLLSSITDPSATLDQQYASAGTTGSGRLADLGPSLEAARLHPFAGTGVGSRVVTGMERNAFILDNQYTSTLLESGAIGLLAVLLLMFVPAFVTARMARATSGLDTEDRDLSAALAASFFGFGVGIFFIDAFGFPQMIFVFFILLAVAGYLRTEAPRSPAADHVSSGFNAPQPRVPTS